ncbi:GNAT family N-acetyltransferase [Bernardetia sp. Wsw4-3y2]|uniref:GNAT family N-acetyltransferase n=1 Tax=Bernardetia sp. Wsw4-3y2 TaxID=3127471 RepID=UPI0030D4ADA8
MITIKKATLNDLENLNLLFDAYRVFYKKESDLEASKEFLRKRIQNNESEIFVAQFSENNSEKLVGFVQLFPIFSSTRLKRFWLLNDLFVDINFRGRGISILLIEEAKKIAVQTESAGLMLETDKNNIEGNQLYPKTGFELDTEHNFYYWSE